MLLYYSCYGVIWPQFAGPLLGLLRIPFSIRYNDLVWSLDFILMLLWAFLTHYIACGLLCPISFIFGQPWLICFPWVFLTHFLIFHSLGILLTFLGFPGPITLSFILGTHGLFINPLLSYFIISGLLWPILTFLHHIMLMGLLLLSSGFFRPIYFPQDLFIYFMGLWSIILAIWV